MKPSSRGFAMIEIMLAVVLLAGAIVILMKGTSSTSNYTNNQSSARAYAVIVNEIMSKFYEEGAECKEANNTNECDFTVCNGNVEDYLNMSDEAIAALTERGIDPSTIKVTTCKTEVGGTC